MFYKNEMDKYYDFLNTAVGVTTDALDLAFGLNGYNKDTAENILDWATGWNDFEQFAEDNNLEF